MVSIRLIHYYGCVCVSYGGALYIIEAYQLPIQNNQFSWHPFCGNSTKHTHTHKHTHIHVFTKWHQPYHFTTYPSFHSNFVLTSNLRPDIGINNRTIIQKIAQMLMAFIQLAMDLKVLHIRVWVRPQFIWL